MTLLGTERASERCMLGAANEVNRCASCCPPECEKGDQASAIDVDASADKPADHGVIGLGVDQQKRGSGFRENRFQVRHLWK